MRAAMNTAARYGDLDKGTCPEPYNNYYVVPLWCYSPYNHGCISAHSRVVAEDWWGVRPTPHPRGALIHTPWACLKLVAALAKATPAFLGAILVGDDRS